MSIRSLSAAPGAAARTDEHWRDLPVGTCGARAALVARRDGLAGVAARAPEGRRWSGRELGRRAARRGSSARQSSAKALQQGHRCKVCDAGFVGEGAPSGAHSLSGTAETEQAERFLWQSGLLLVRPDGCRSGDRRRTAMTLSTSSWLGTSGVFKASYAGRRWDGGGPRWPTSRRTALVPASGSRQRSARHAMRAAASVVRSAANTFTNGAAPPAPPAPLAAPTLMPVRQTG
jgi:hypothetical protein